MELKVTLLAHTQLTHDLQNKLFELAMKGFFTEVTDGQAVSLMAIRQCYSHKTALEVLETESEKYFGNKGKEAKRLFRQIVMSKHTSTLEHLNFTFAIEGVSRSLLAQLTRHRHMSFSVQSQRYCKFSSDSRSGGFDYVVPDSIKDEVVTREIDGDTYEANPKQAFDDMMRTIQEYYDFLRKCGVPAEDARAVLPNVATCNLVLTANLRTLLDFYSKRKAGNGAQKEISDLAEELKNRVIEVEPWTTEFFQ